MAKSYDRKDVLGALEQRLDYWSARVLLGDLVAAAGRPAADSFGTDDIRALAEAAEEAGDATSLKAAAALRARFEQLDGEAAENLATAKAAAEQAAREEAAAKKAAAEKAAAEKAAKEKAAAEKAAKEKAEKEKAAAEKAAAEKAAQEKAARDKAEAEAAAKEKAAREKAEKEKAAKEKAARETPQVVVVKPGDNPVDPERPILVIAPAAGTMHWGVNGWKPPEDAWLPADTTPADDGNARRTPLAQQPDHGDRWGVVLRPVATHGGKLQQVDVTFQFEDGSWWDGSAALRPK